MLNGMCEPKTTAFDGVLSVYSILFGQRFSQLYSLSVRIAYVQRIVHTVVNRSSSAVDASVRTIRMCLFAMISWLNFPLTIFALNL